MDKKISFFQRMKTNIYVRTFFLSIGTIVLSYLIVLLLILIEHQTSQEIVLFLILIFNFIFIYYLFQKKYIKWEFSKKQIIVPWLFLWLILFPFVNELIDELKRPTYDYPVAHKPIIYLYPENKQEINVKLDVEWELIADYPKYDENIGGWNVTVYPDGKVIENGKEYSYLFWEAEFDNNNWNLNKWFIVEWRDAREFLEEKLSYMWLTPREYNEFIVYWYPKMMNNKYNLIYFAWDDYEQRAPLDITPKPDSILRVFMVIKPLDEKIDIEEQKLSTFIRKWFSVVEWGWTILND